MSAIFLYRIFLLAMSGSDESFGSGTKTKSSLLWLFFLLQKKNKCLEKF